MKITKKLTALVSLGAVGFLLATNPVVAQAADQITGLDIKNNTVTSVDIKDGSLLLKDLKVGQLPQVQAPPAAEIEATAEIDLKSLNGKIPATLDVKASTWTFLGPQVEVTLPVASTVAGSAMAPIAADLGLADVKVDLCFQVAGSPVTNFKAEAGSASAVKVGPVRTSYAVSSSVELPAATYVVGVCAKAAVATVKLVDNDVVNGWITVTKTPH